MWVADPQVTSHVPETTTPSQSLFIPASRSSLEPGEIPCRRALKPHRAELEYRAYIFLAKSDPDFIKSDPHPSPSTQSKQTKAPNPQASQPDPVTYDRSFIALNSKLAEIGLTEDGSQIEPADTHHQETLHTLPITSPPSTENTPSPPATQHAHAEAIPASPPTKEELGIDLRCPVGESRIVTIKFKGSKLIVGMEQIGAVSSSKLDLQLIC